MDINGVRQGFIIYSTVLPRFNYSYQEKTMRFDTGLGLTSVDHLTSLVTGSHQNGARLIVDFWPDAFVTLENVQPDQISWNDVSVLS